MIELEGVALDYPAPPGARERTPGGRAGAARVHALAGADLRVDRGAICAIIGPSGCGKTSLLRLLAGLERPSAGRILVDGRVLDGPREKSAVIFQDFGLLPWKTVEANAELQLRLRGLPAAERRERVAPILRELGLSDFARWFPSRLSGGMRQRVAVARAFAAEPDLLLMDEPFSSLDAMTREALQETLLQVQRRHGTTIALVTHSIEEAAYLADIIYVMRHRNPGSVVARIETGRQGREGGGVRDFRTEPRYLELTTELRAALAGAERDTGDEE